MRWIRPLPSILASDGEPFSSKDVVFTYRLLANPAAGSAHAAKFDHVVGIADYRSGKATDGVLSKVAELQAAWRADLRLLERESVAVRTVTPRHGCSRQTACIAGSSAAC